MGLITAVSAAGLAAGLAFTGASSASAGDTITIPVDSALGQRITKFCDRVPTLIERTEKAETRINGGVDTQGSLAWLQARRATAVAKGHPRVVRRIDTVIVRREARLKKLPTLRANLTSAQTQCASLNLPSASSSPSSTGAAS